MKLRLLFTAVCISSLGLVAMLSAADMTAKKGEKLLAKPDSLEKAEAQATELMKAMTPEERIDFVGGTGFGVRAVERLGIPALRFDDASAGLRLQGKKAKEGNNKTTGFPCTILLAATWDPALAHDYAQAIAEEYRTLGSHFILGPGMDMYRNSLNGRSFEYVGEDPYLAAQIIASYVKGAQGMNVATTLKHFIGNETESHRRSSNSIISDRALHEIYMPPFKAGIDAGSWGVMTAYNLVNGQWAGQSEFVCTELLRNQLGFKFLIMTDWDSVWDGNAVAKSGMDLEMPTGWALQKDQAKLLGNPDIDRMVVTILKTGIYSGIYELEVKKDFIQPTWVKKYPEHAAIAGKANHEGIVLLKNSDILPLEKARGKVLVTGNAAMREELAGGGSGHVKGYDSKTYLQAAQAAYGAGAVSYVKNPTDDEIKAADAVLVFSGRNNGDPGYEGEGADHAFELPEDALIANYTKLNPRTIVTVVSGGGAKMDWADQAGAILYAFYGGQTGATALLDIMTGKVNPSGKLPITIEKRFEDSCAAGEKQKPQIVSTNFDPKTLGDRVSGGMKGEMAHNGDKTEYYTVDMNYDEGVFIGYRWYDEKKIEPRFPFGFGLSYTQFAYSDLKIEPAAEGKPGATVRFKITNTGKKDGEEVAQVYVGDPEASQPRPPRELKGFSRVALKAGESKDVTVELKEDAFSFWNPETKVWVAEPGAFTIDVGASSRDIKLSGGLDVK
jgi:beta-glucosidase